MPEQAVQVAADTAEALTFSLLQVGAIGAVCIVQFIAIGVILWRNAAEQEKQAKVDQQREARRGKTANDALNRKDSVIEKTNERLMDLLGEELKETRTTLQDLISHMKKGTSDA